MNDDEQTPQDSPGETPAVDGQEPALKIDKTPPKPREFGGRDGLDPTRYGDWEKNGRCIDF